MKTLIFGIVLFSASILFAQNGIIGTWQNNELSALVFNSNGNGSFGGGNFTYTATSNKIFASSEDGYFIYNYKLVNSQIVVSGGIFPNPVTFSKNKTTINSNSSNTNKTGSIDKSIVGTWCCTNASSTYTSSSSNTRWIVINANGTYEYTYEGSIGGYGGSYYGGSSNQNSERGTWKLNGNTISIVSQNDGAQNLSFQKKNHPNTGDPMIVIDGDAYATYYQKSPW